MSFEDLNTGGESILQMSGGSELKRLGAEGLKALLPVVLRQTEGTR